jgi:hypothetical protein
MTNLCELLKGGSRPDLVCEILDGIYDIYADVSYDYDRVFVSNGFLNLLTDGYPHMKKMTKSLDGRKHRELRSRCDQMLSNMGAFITYKKAEVEQ